MGPFGKSLESNGDFSMRCQCLTSNLLRRYVGKCGQYVVVKVRRSPALWGLFASVPTPRNRSGYHQRRTTEIPPNKL